MGSAVDFPVRVSELIEALGSPDQKEDVRWMVERRGVQTLADLARILDDAGATAKEQIIACWLIGRLGRGRAAWPLIRALSHGVSPAVQCQAARTLGSLGTQRGLRALAAVARFAKSSVLRFAAVQGIAMTYRPAAAALLLEILRDPKELPRVRAAAAEGLADFPGAPAERALIGSLADSSRQVRFWTAFALGSVGTRRSLRPLALLAERDTSRACRWGSVRKEATESIERIRVRLRQGRGSRLGRSSGGACGIGSEAR